MFFTDGGLVRLLKRSMIAAGCVLALASSAEAQRPGVGQVAFANSGAAAAQQDFLTGLAQLHNFEYGPAAELFRKAQQADPGFAMAYWGEAMTHNHAVWMEQDAAAARAILQRLGATPEARLAKAKTEREKDYLRAVEIAVRRRRQEGARLGLRRRDGPPAAQVSGRRGRRRVRGAGAPRHRARRTRLRDLHALRRDPRAAVSLAPEASRASRTI